MVSVVRPLVTYLFLWSLMIDKKKSYVTLDLLKNKAFSLMTKINRYIQVAEVFGTLNLSLRTGTWIFV